MALIHLTGKSPRKLSKFVVVYSSMGIENGGYQPPEYSMNFQDFKLTVRDEQILEEIDRLRAYDQDFQEYTQKVNELEQKKAAIKGVSWTRRREINSWIKARNREIEYLKKGLMQEFGIHPQEIERLILKKETTGSE